MRRWLVITLLLLLPAAAWADAFGGAAPTSAASPITPTGGNATTLGAALATINVATTGTTYTGPCDLVSCAAAYSPARSLTAAYTGPLFQLIRATDSATLNVGQVNHIADMTTEVQFCANTSCFFSVLYDQIGSEDLTPPVNTGGFTPGLCNATNACAPPYFVDPSSGLPIIRTPYPTMLYNGTSAPAIVGGANPISIMWYGNTAGWSTCCGLFGVAHAANATDVAGQDFIPGLGRGTGNPFVNCGSATAVCAQVDIEQFSQGPDYTPATVSSMFNVVTFDGPSATNTITQYVNSSTSSFTGTPSATMAPGTTVRLGGGGDLSHVDGVFSEGIVSNALLPSGRVAALLSNNTTFYGARSADACKSSADFGYFWNTTSGGQGNNPGIANTVWAGALRRMSASYTGPIADLTDNAGTTRTFGPSKHGCFMSQAAQTFCAANSPCKVSKLYNQATFTTQNNSAVHDTNLDLVQATSAARPTVKFGGLNGLPTMVFAGAQSLCTAALVTSDQTPITLMAFIAKRTGTFTAFNQVVATGNGSSDGMGFNNSANNVNSFFGGNLVAAATDSAFHSVIWEAPANTASAVNLYVGGASITTGTQASYHNFSQNGASSKVCLGISQTAANPLTGEIAEAIVGSTISPTTPYPSVAATLYSAHTAAWGSGI